MTAQPGAQRAGADHEPAGPCTRPAAWRQGVETTPGASAGVRGSGRCLLHFAKRAQRHAGVRACLRKEAHGRERDVVELLGRSLSLHEIAERLVVEHETVTPT